MPTWRGDGVRGGGVVAGEHPHLDAECLQLGNRLGGFGFDGVGDREHRGRGPSTATNIGVRPAGGLGGGDGASAEMSTPRAAISAALPTSTCRSSTVASMP